MPALSRIEALVTPSVLTSNVQQSCPFDAFDWKLTTPCSPIPASLAASTGCIVAAPAVAAPSTPAAATPARPNLRNCIFVTSFVGTPSGGSRPLLAVWLQGAYAELKSAQ